jgi:hypothetical protein
MAMAKVAYEVPLGHQKCSQIRVHKKETWNTKYYSDLRPNIILSLSIF